MWSALSVMSAMSVMSVMSLMSVETAECDGGGLNLLTYLLTCLLTCVSKPPSVMGVDSTRDKLPLPSF